MWPDDDAAVARRRMREAERETLRGFHRFCLAVFLAGLAVVGGLVLVVWWWKGGEL